MLLGEQGITEKKIIINKHFILFILQDKSSQRHNNLPAEEQKKNGHFFTAWTSSHCSHHEQVNQLKKSSTNILSLYIRQEKSSQRYNNLPAEEQEKNGHSLHHEQVPHFSWCIPWINPTRTRMSKRLPNQRLSAILRWPVGNKETTEQCPGAELTFRLPNACKYFVNNVFPKGLGKLEKFIQTISVKYIPSWEKLKLVSKKDTYPAKYSL